MDKEINLLTRRKFLQLMGMGAVCALLPTSQALAHGEIADGPSGDTPLGRVCYYRVVVYSEPDVKSGFVSYLKYDEVFKLPEVVTAVDSQKRIRGWYKLAEDQYTETAWIQPVFNRPNAVSSKIFTWGALGEISVPMTDVYNAPLGKKINRKFYYSNTFWILSRIFDAEGKAWYELLDDYNGLSFYVHAEAVRLVGLDELRPLSADVPPDQKRLEVDLREQRVRAFEYDKQVFDVFVSTGLAAGSTPVGTFKTHRKRPCRRMVNEPAAGPNHYDLPGVPWVSYITSKGVAFHGAYWHSNWGNRMSNGCINMKPEDAKWIYRWCNPQVPFVDYYYEEPDGTHVDVIN